MRKLLLGAFVICISSVILLIFFEAGLRALSWEPERKIAYDFNESYLISLKPNLRTYFKRSQENGGDLVKWETNSDSFRGQEVQTNPDIRIIVYGDSNIQASFSKLEDTFCWRLARYLTRRLPTKRIEVLNSGIVGSGPDQYLIKLSQDAGRYKPDLVIFNIFSDNDYGDITRNRLFDLDDNGNLVPTKFEKQKDELLTRAETRSRGLVGFLASLRICQETRNAFQRLHAQSLTPQDIIHRRLADLQAEYLAYKRSEPRTVSHFDDSFDFDVALFPHLESSQTKIGLMEAVLREAQKLAVARNVEFLVTIEPSAVDLTENYMVSYKDLQGYKDYRRRNLTYPIETICRKHGIHMVSLFDVFMVSSPECQYFRGFDQHWNDRGQDLAARVVAAYIANNMLKGGPRNRSGEQVNAQR